MVTRGRVQGGVVVLENGARLPEGQAVAVCAIDTVPGGTPEEAPRAHSVLDVPPVSLGAVVRPPGVDDDLLEEMLDGRV
jgi:hypothetical protein